MFLLSTVLFPSRCLQLSRSSSMSSLSREVSQHLNQVPLAGPHVVHSHPCLPATHPTHHITRSTLHHLHPTLHPPNPRCLPAHPPAVSSISNSVSVLNNKLKLIRVAVTTIKFLIFSHASDVTLWMVKLWSWLKYLNN